MCEFSVKGPRPNRFKVRGSAKSYQTMFLNMIGSILPGLTEGQHLGGGRVRVVVGQQEEEQKDRQSKNVPVPPASDLGTPNQTPCPLLPQI